MSDVIKNQGAPTVQTFGNIGDYYIDTLDDKIYKCVDVKCIPVQYQFVDIYRHHPDRVEYVWERIGPDPDQFDVMKNTVLDTNGVVFSFMDEVPEKFKYLDKNVTAVSFPLAKTVGKNSFQSCSALTSADFPSATVIGDAAFNRCGLSAVSFPEVKHISKQAFQSSNSLASVDFPKVESIEDMAFSSCKLLEEINMPNLERTIFDVTGSTFGTCTALSSVYFPKLIEISNNCFQYCENLTDVKFPSVEIVGTRAFTQCTKLRSIEFQKMISLPSRLFYHCYSLKVVILRSETMCALDATDAFGNCYHFLGTVNVTYNPDGLKDGYIYVPKAIIEDYKAATNWSTYADRFRALEDYTVDGTITGELDESKI